MSNTTQTLGPTAQPLPPPGPRGLPLIGDSLALGRDTLGYLNAAARNYGAITRIPLGFQQLILVAHPALIEEVLVAQNKIFPKENIEQMRGSLDYLLFGVGLLTSNGDFWLRQRRLAQPAFHRQRISAYGQAMVEHTERMLARWKPGTSLDIHEAMMGLTLDIVAETLFGAKTTEDAATISQALGVVMDVVAGTLGKVFPLPTYLPTPTNLRFRRAVSSLERSIGRIIDGRRASGEDTGDLLSMLLHARDDDGQGMSDKQLRDEAVTLFIAGHETTALALSWAFYLLGQNPAVEARLAAELAEVLGGRAPTLDDLPRLPYTGLVLKETMRIYPPAWALSLRQATKDTLVGGYHIGRGDLIMPSPWVTHRDPQLFAEPERFNPERWEGDLEQQLPRFAYFPFGGGQRQCIGQSFAIMEATLILAAILGRYRLALAPGWQATPQPSITLRPREGVRVTLHSR